MKAIGTISFFSLLMTFPANRYSSLNTNWSEHPMHPRADLWNLKYNTRPTASHYHLTTSIYHSIPFLTPKRVTDWQLKLRETKLITVFLQSKTFWRICFIIWSSFLEKVSGAPWEIGEIWPLQENCQCEKLCISDFLSWASSPDLAFNFTYGLLIILYIVIIRFDDI